MTYGKRASALLYNVSFEYFCFDRDFALFVYLNISDCMKINIAPHFRHIEVHRGALYFICSMSFMMTCALKVVVPELREVTTNSILNVHKTFFFPFLFP